MERNLLWFYFIKVIFIATIIIVHLFFNMAKN